MIFTSFIAQFVKTLGVCNPASSENSISPPRILRFKLNLTIHFFLNWLALISSVLITTELFSILLNHLYLQILLASLLIYSVIAWRFFQHWFQVFQQSPELDCEEKFISKWVLAIATLLWPLTVPLSLLETRMNYVHPPTPEMQVSDTSIEQLT